MNFNKLCEQIDKIQGELGYISQGHIDTPIFSPLEVNEYLDNVLDMISDVRETYAPIVELTQEQKNVWDEAILESAKDKCKDDFIYFIDTLELCDWQTHFFDKELDGFRFYTRKLMNMWLHPETIKVVDKNA